MLYKSTVKCKPSRTKLIPDPSLSKAAAAMKWGCWSCWGVGRRFPVHGLHHRRSCLAAVFRRPPETPRRNPPSTSSIPSARRWSSNRPSSRSSRKRRKWAFGRRTRRNRGRIDGRPTDAWGKKLRTAPIGSWQRRPRPRRRRADSCRRRASGCRERHRRRRCDDVKPCVRATDADSRGNADEGFERRRRVTKSHHRCRWGECGEVRNEQKLFILHLHQASWWYRRNYRSETFLKYSEAAAPTTIGQNRKKKQRKNSHLIIHFATSKGLNEVSE